jgi:hypothetical protein
MVHTPLKVEFHITAPDNTIHPFRVSPPVTTNIPQETACASLDHLHGVSECDSDDKVCMLCPSGYVGLRIE